MINAKYDFELDKIIKYVGDSTDVMLQFPEGLIRYAADIAQCIENKTSATCLILGDVVYGACNYDMALKTSLNIGKYIHFGHTKIVNDGQNNQLFIPCVLKLQLAYQFQTLLNHIQVNKFEQIQFTATAQTVLHGQQLCDYLKQFAPNLQVFSHKLSTLNQNEILGCTCPKLQAPVVYSLVDGIFHMEAVCISNPNSKIYQYNLETNEIKLIKSEVDENLQSRKNIIKMTKTKLQNKQIHRVNIVFGTLGQQSSLKSLYKLIQQLQELNIQYQVQPLQEIFPMKILMENDLIIQLACPRLSFDWGREFDSKFISLQEFNDALVTQADIEDYTLMNFCGDETKSGIYLDFCQQ